MFSWWACAHPLSRGECHRPEFQLGRAQPADDMAETMPPLIVAATSEAEGGRDPSRPGWLGDPAVWCQAADDVDRTQPHREVVRRRRENQRRLLVWRVGHCAGSATIQLVGVAGPDLES